jgi:aldehyde oxidoreductase
MAEVEVDTKTGKVRVIKMTTAVDAGPVINAHNFEGQLDGGMDQGVGYALREEYVHGKTVDYVTFKFPTINDCFDIEIIVRETPREKGPLGATGIGEMTMVSTAPAVTNAIRDACGVRIYDIPATPQKIQAALAATQKYVASSAVCIPRDASDGSIRADIDTQSAESFPEESCSPISVFLAETCLEPRFPRL